MLSRPRGSVARRIPVSPAAGAPLAPGPAQALGASTVLRTEVLPERRLHLPVSFVTYSR